MFKKLDEIGQKEMKKWKKVNNWNKKVQKVHKMRIYGKIEWRNESLSGQYVNGTRGSNWSINQRKVTFDECFVVWSEVRRGKRRQAALNVMSDGDGADEDGRVLMHPIHFGVRGCGNRNSSGKEGGHGSRYYHH